MIAISNRWTAIVRQFLDYARRAPQQPAERIDLSALSEQAPARVRVDADAHTTLNLRVAHGMTVNGYRTELDRALDNLLVNAMRYGRDPVTGRLDLPVRGQRRPGCSSRWRITDRVPTEQMEPPAAPFERATARAG